MTFHSRYKERKSRVCSCGEVYNTPGRVCLKCMRKAVTGKGSESEERLVSYSVPQLLRIAQGECNEYIRKRDEGKPCWSSGVKWESTFQAGHCFPAGKYSGVRFDEQNIAGQSLADNYYKLDDTSLKEAFKKRIGRLEFELLEARAEATRFHKWDRNELVKVIIEFREKLKGLKK